MPRSHGFDAILVAARSGAEWAWVAIYRDLAGPVMGYFASHEVSDPDDLASELSKEASTLAERGEVESGLAHATESLIAEGESAEGARECAESLLAAADAVMSGGDEGSAEVSARVAEMLRWMASTDASGDEAFMVLVFDTVAPDEVVGIVRYRDEFDAAMSE
jgi:hypothetical protein